MKWLAFVLLAAASGVYITIPTMRFVAVLTAFVAGWAYNRSRLVGISGSIRYVCDDGRSKLHLDECPVLAGAREGDGVRMWVERVQGARHD